MTSSLADRLATLDAERATYILESLAVHLAEAGRSERLKALFANDAWLQARFRGSGFVYEGYLADLEIAWDRSAQPQALRQIEAGEGPTGFAEVIRYALIRTTIQSLAGTVPPELVARAVEDGLWSVTRAMSVAVRIPDPLPRVRLWTQLLESRRLTEEEREQAMAEALDAARQVAGEDGTAALAALIPHLAPDLLAQALALGEARKGLERVTVLASVAGCLEDPQRAGPAGKALRVMSRLDTYDLDDADVWQALAPVLDGPLLTQALRRARRLDNKGRLAALSALAPRLDEDEQTAAFEDALAAARAIPDDYTRVYALSRVVGRFEGAGRDDAARLLLESSMRTDVIDYEHDIPRIVGLTAAMPYLDQIDVPQAVEAALDIGDIEEIRKAVVQLLVACARRLSGAARAEVIERALGLARAPRPEGTDEGPWEVAPLAAVAPLLEGSIREAVLEAAFQRALELPTHVKQNLEWVDRRSEALAMLAPQLSGAILERALRPLTVGDPDACALALATLTSRLSGIVRARFTPAVVRALAEIRDSNVAKDTVIHVLPLLPDGALEGVLEVAGAIGWESARGDALAAVGPRLSEALARAAFETCLAIGYDPARSAAIVGLAGSLPEDLLESAFERSLMIDWEPGHTQSAAAVAHRLPTRRRRNIAHAALERIAESKEEEHRRSDMLQALAPILDTPALARAGRDLALHVDWDLGRAKALAAMVPQLPARDLQIVVKSLPSLGRYQSDVLRQLAPRLPPGLLSKSLDAVLTGKEAAIDDGLSALAPALTPDLTKRALALITSMKNDLTRATALEKLAPAIDRPTGPLGLKAALGVRDPGLRGRALAAVAPRLDGEDRARAVAAGLEAAKITSEPWPKAKAMAALAPLAAKPTRKRALRDALHAALQLIGQRRYIDPNAPIVALLPHLDGPALMRALVSLTNIDELSERATALAPFTAPESAAGLATVRLALGERLRATRNGSRAELLSILAVAPLVLAPVLDDATLEAAADAVVELTWEWDWP